MTKFARSMHYRVMEVCEANKQIGSGVMSFSFLSFCIFCIFIFFSESKGGRDYACMSTKKEKKKITPHAFPHKRRETDHFNANDKSFNAFIYTTLGIFLFLFLIWKHTHQVFW